MEQIGVPHEREIERAMIRIAARRGRAVHRALPEVIQVEEAIDVGLESCDVRQLLEAERAAARKAPEAVPVLLPAKPLLRRQTPAYLHHRARLRYGPETGRRHRWIGHPSQGRAWWSVAEDERSPWVVLPQQAERKRGEGRRVVRPGDPALVLRMVGSGRA